jgi:hypothetical protein
MISERKSAPPERRHWADWVSVHMWWTALLAGGILCGAALILS